MAHIYLLAIAIFCNEVKGKSMLAMSRDLGVQYKTSFVLAHKMREAMASEVKTGDKIGGEGKRAEIDGGYFGEAIRLSGDQAEYQRSGSACQDIRLSRLGDWLGFRTRICEGCAGGKLRPNFKVTTHRTRGVPPPQFASRY
jgi:hypothetical protein